ncbi:MAG: M15 family metallopeptidase [Desulfobacterales bacterium]|nr:M15 family metallopeptidase [Desulfobacterales bacterium]
MGECKNNIMIWKLSKNSLKNRTGIDHKLIEINELALTISPIDFGIPKYGGLRTDKEQYKLFIDGGSKCDGYNKKSYHQTGKALDFYAYVNGHASWEEHHLTTVAAAHLQAASILGYKLEWGGFWKNFRDFPHLQLKD